MIVSRPAFTGPELCAYEAHEVVAMLKRGEISPRDCIDAALARIETVEPAINAIPTICADRAYAAAEALDSTEADAAGWLAGLPLGIKDLNDVAGVRTTYGNRALADYVPDTSDMLVSRIESRGGIVIGKTNTPEFGAGANTFNDVFGVTRNPWDPVLNAGGSSGGAAASLATGETWLSHGSDHGGSLRTPAGYCGIVGMRPSPGRAAGASNAGFMIEGIDGPMARSVRDCALFLDAMSGFNPESPISFPGDEHGSFQDAVIRATPKIKIAFSADLGGMAQVDAEVLSHLQGVMQAMESAGADVRETCPELPNLERTYHTLRGIGYATSAQRMPEAVSRAVKQTIVQNVALGRALTIDDIADANLDRTIIYNNMVRPHHIVIDNGTIQIGVCNIIDGQSAPKRHILHNRLFYCARHRFWHALCRCRITNAAKCMVGTLQIGQFGAGFPNIGTGRFHRLHDTLQMAQYLGINLCHAPQIG